MLCQTLNAEYGSKSVPVAHIVVDGGGRRARHPPLSKMLGPECHQQLREACGMEHDGLILPARIAGPYWHVAQAARV